MATQNAVSQKKFLAVQDCIEMANSYIKERYENEDDATKDAIRREYINHYLGMSLDDYEINNCSDPLKLDNIFIENINSIPLEHFLKKLDECGWIVALASSKIGETKSIEALRKLKNMLASEINEGSVRVMESYNYNYIDGQIHQYTLSLKKELQKDLAI